MHAQTTPVMSDRNARRDTRPPHGDTATARPRFEALDRTHRQLLQVLADMDAWLDELARDGLTASTRQSAMKWLAFFDHVAAPHHAEEERRVFPLLLAQDDAELCQQVLRLQQDHHWIEADWRELGPWVRAVADGLGGWDVHDLRSALQTFAALCTEHVVLEETVVYPAARRLLGADPHKPTARG